MTTDPADLVVLLDEQGRPCGTADRLSVHSTTTPLHLAFSCYLIDGRGHVLMTRRALGKRTWPGVWTNACCGHPRPGESMVDAVARRVADELGTRTGPIVPVLPDFRYEAVDASGVRENEVCPVFVASVSEALDPDPSEVMEHTWAAPADLATVAASSPWLLSPWSVEQMRRMDMTSLAAAVEPA